VSVEDFLARLTLALEEAEIPYMLAGSFASTFHGEPRTTQDVDLVIHADASGLRRFLRSLSPDEYYADEQAAHSALRRLGQFNVIDMATGWKADLIFRKARPFSVAEFERRRQVDFLGARLWMATPEDVVISKLEWAKRTGSERQLRDVAGVVAARQGELDVAYIECWVEALDLAEQWTRTRRA
jgi:hypothetical protein